LRQLPQGAVHSAFHVFESLGARYRIRSIPTLALFMNGREVARQPGAMGVGDIVRWTQAQMRTGVT
jgi:thioredoxin-like negative regulator of GroEL